MELTDEAFVQVCITKLNDMNVGIIHLHEDDDSAASAFLIDKKTMRAIADLIPRNDEAINVFMNHEHIVVGEEDA